MLTIWFELSSHWRECLSFLHNYVHLHNLSPPACSLLLQDPPQLRSACRINNGHNPMYRVLLCARHCYLAPQNPPGITSFKPILQKKTSSGKINNPSKVIVVSSTGGRIQVQVSLTPSANLSTGTQHSSSWDFPCLSNFPMNPPLQWGRQVSWMFPGKVRLSLCSCLSLCYFPCCKHPLLHSSKYYNSFKLLFGTVLLKSSPTNPAPEWFHFIRIFFVF